MRRGGLPDAGMIFFQLTSWELGLLFFAVILGATGLGVFLGRRVRHLSESLKEPFGVLQAALLGLVALLLAFGLSLAVSRYEDRRSNIVTEANAIGTTYLRAQTLRGAGPQPLARPAGPLHAERACALSDAVPGSDEADAARAQEERIERRLWSLAGDALDTAPIASAPRLYVETLNEMFDAETVRVAVAQQPGTDRRPGARGTRLRPGARVARRLPGDRRKGRARGPARVGARGLPAARDRRPRSSDTRDDPGPRHRAEGPARLDGGTARRHRAPLPLETQRGPAGRRLNSRIAAVPFTLRNLKEDLEDVGSNFDGAPDLEFRLATKALELEQSGLSYQRIPPDYRFPYGHTHKEQEEVYVVVRGSGRMKLDDEIVEVKEWDVVRVPPGTWRGYEGGPEGLEILVFGAPNLGEDPREDVEGQRDWWAD